MNQQLLTISQLARYVGVTVRAVRHYHALGLLPEPKRDSSGYRRYDANAVVELTRIKILVGAGVPLSQVETLMHAKTDVLEKAIVSIKADIAERIAKLAATQKRLDGLQSGDRMFVSEVVADYLDSLRHIGLSATTVSHERDAWILISALYPEQVDAWAVQKKLVITKPDIAALYRRLDEALQWPADDPRFSELAKDMLHISQQQRASSVPDQDKLTSNMQALSLVAGYGVDAFPSWKQLQETIKTLTDKPGQ
ncbi:MAG TPA: MerR family transcriptional regulator [Patescibacteria group bacterium]|nr:MerR family transcriptional regulator [Patescibacteria group bacterium]